MTDPSAQQKAATRWGALGVGALLITIAVFTDPMGASPDTGVIDLGSMGTRWLLGILGGAMVLGGIWLSVREKLLGGA